MIEWNLIAFVALICSLLSGVSAVMTLAARRQGAHLIWGVLSICVALWCLGLAFCFASPSAELALFWALALNCVALFLPPLVYHFVGVFLGWFDGRRRTLLVYYAIALCGLVSILIRPDLYLHSPSLRMESFWFPLAGPAFYLFVLFYTWVFGHAVVTLLRARERQGRQKRLQINYLLIAVALGGLAGGSTIPLEFEFDYPPLGILGVAVMDVLFTYAILRHELLSIPETISRVFARLTAYLCIFVVSILLADALAVAFEMPLSAGQLAIFGVLTVLVGEVYQWIKSRIQALADRVLLRLARKRQEAVAVFCRELDQLGRLDALQLLLSDLMDALDFVHFYGMYVDKTLWMASSNKNENPHSYPEGTMLRLRSQEDRDFKDELPEQLSIPEAGTGRARSGPANQMTALMSGKQLDRAYDWVEEVPQRELLVLPLVYDQQVHGVLMLVVGSPDFAYPDQALLARAADGLSSLLQRLHYQMRDTLETQHRMNERLRSMRAIAGTIAHEMRSPLGQLDFFVGEVSDYIERHQNRGHDLKTDAGLDQVQMGLGRAKTAIDRSLQVIEMMLGQLRGDQFDTGNFRRLSVHESVRRAVAEYRYLPGERERLRLQLDQEFSYHGDESLFIYLIFNLLKNAFCYLHLPDFCLEIRTATIDDVHHLIVEDNGPGIEAEHVTRLFDDFFSLRKEGGSGLGLAYCRRVMRAFGGDIRCESVPGDYTRFLLSFPSSSSN